MTARKATVGVGVCLIISDRNNRASRKKKYDREILSIWMRQWSVDVHIEIRSVQLRQSPAKCTIFTRPVASCVSVMGFDIVGDWHFTLAVDAASSRERELAESRSRASWLLPCEWGIVFAMRRRARATDSHVTSGRYVCKHSLWLRQWRSGESSWKSSLPASGAALRRATVLWSV